MPANYSPGSPYYRAPAAGFNINPNPMSGTGAYGEVPGVIGLPNPAGDLGAQYPNLPGTNQQASDVILSKLRGQVSPGTMNALQTAAAQFGVQSGMPGSGLQMNKLFGNIAGFAENQAQQGLQDYASIIPTVSRTQTVTPELQTEIAARNAINLAAPNPQQAQSAAERLFNSYLSGMRGGGAVSGLPRTQGEFNPYVTGGFSSDRPNMPALGPTGNFGGYGGTSFGGYGGTGFGGYGGSNFAGGGGSPTLDDMAFLREFGEDPAAWGYGPGGGFSYIAPPNTPYSGTQDYSQPIGPQGDAVSNAQLDNLINSDFFSGG